MQKRLKESTTISAAGRRRKYSTRNSPVDSLDIF